MSVVQGQPSEQAAATSYRDSAGLVVPIMIFLGLAIMLGLYIPPPLQRLLNEAVNYLEVAP